jgi:hypothetical protein
MRPDMSKLIVERPRRKSWLGKSNQPTRIMRRAAKLDPENAFAPRGMHRAAMVSHGKHLKSLSENLAPLRRFLHGAVGRPWSEVHSEICRNIRLSSAVQLHILQHIGDFVETPSSPPTRHWRPELWVDPSDGVLKRRAHTPKRRGALASTGVSLVRWRCADDPMRHYWKVGDEWFRIECRGRYMNECGIPDWMARLPAWFTALTNRLSDRYRWTNVCDTPSQAETRLASSLLGPDAFPMRAAKMSEREVRHEMRKLADRGMSFTPRSAA